MNTLLRDLYLGAKILFLFSLTAILISGSRRLINILNRVDIASAQLLDCVTVDSTGVRRGNPACLQAQLLAITGSTRATMGAVAKAAPEIAQSIRSASLNSVQASLATTQATDSAVLLLSDSRETVKELQRTLVALRSSVRDLSDEGTKMIAAGSTAVLRAYPAIDQLAILERSLTAQVEQQSPEIGRTLMAMQRILNDPALASLVDHVDGIAANTEKGTKHLAETSETIDIATRSLRQKAGRVKWVIEKVLGIIKITLPVF